MSKTMLEKEEERREESKFVDSRATAVEEISAENVASKVLDDLLPVSDDPTDEAVKEIESQGLDAPDLPPGFETISLPDGSTITRLTKEGLEARQNATPETLTPEQQAALMREAYEKAEAKEKALTEALSGIGTYILVRFQDPTSVRNVVTFSSPRPEDRTTIAVLNRIVREMQAYEVMHWHEGAAKIEADSKKESEDAMLRQEALKRGLPLNRKTLRALRKELKEDED